MKGKWLKLFSSKLVVVIAFTILVQGCALTGNKSNSDKLAKLAGEDFVLSNGAKVVDFSLLFTANNSANTVLSLVPEADQATVANLHQGNRSLSQSITLADSSSAIVSSLAQYYQKKYQVRFIAKGTIRNISPDYLQRALKKGRYVLDVRLVQLTLVPDQSRSRFYPSGTYQLSVIDAKKAKVVIEDQCRFDDAKKSQQLAAFSANNGKVLSDFLSANASACLNQFALGESKQETTGATPQVEAKKPVVVKRSTSQSTAAVSVGASYQFTKDAFDTSQTLQGYNALYLLNKPLQDGKGLVFQSELTVLGQNEWPDFSTPVYAAAMGLGASFESEKYSDVSYAVLATAKLGQYRQQLLALSTNSIGVEVQAIKVVFDTIVLTGRYGFDKHIGQTKDANSISHLFGVALGYRFGGQ
ncbi:hypothetical protein [Reinekea sp.]|uniref:hypothetical protein n=1 Tax=Reinekea sp. TaxID=1970455 RepID=UPI003988F1E4